MLLPTRMFFECFDMKDKAAWLAEYIVVVFGTCTIRTSVPLQCGRATVVFHHG